SGFYAKRLLGSYKRLRMLDPLLFPEQSCDSRLRLKLAHRDSTPGKRISQEVNYGFGIDAHSLPYAVDHLVTPSGRYCNCVPCKNPARRGDSVSRPESPHPLARTEPRNAGRPEYLIWPPSEIERKRRPIV